MTMQFRFMNCMYVATIGFSLVKYHAKTLPKSMWYVLSAEHSQILIKKNLDFVQSVSLGAMAKTVPARAASARLDHVTMKMVDVKVDVWLGIKEQLVTKVLV